MKDESANSLDMMTLPFILPPSSFILGFHGNGSGNNPSPSHSAPPSLATIPVSVCAVRNVPLPSYGSHGSSAMLTPSSPIGVAVPTPRYTPWIVSPSRTLIVFVTQPLKSIARSNTSVTTNASQSTAADTNCGDAGGGGTLGNGKGARRNETSRGVPDSRFLVRNRHARRRRDGGAERDGDGVESRHGRAHRRRAHDIRRVLRHAV